MLSGKPQQYCNYAFKTFNTNDKKTINFDEFMSAIALTLPGDVELQLTRVCLLY
jgi:Ca2+-binding EF-hand superfamily protein